MSFHLHPPLSNIKQKNLQIKSMRKTSSRPAMITPLIYGECLKNYTYDKDKVRSP